ncbi:hypothetical protein AMTR_s00099p00154280 [Amborella trichopoda]|uniref:Uncharacterized protein n=1 Tax=Amborella trichopoda TaxID=13333 RepID=W1NW07_AMBTC|nr:hypothetical protein AMTR_s00099p00154280 [Amborella trichopoda]
MAKGHSWGVEIRENVQLVVVNENACCCTKSRKRLRKGIHTVGELWIHTKGPICGVCMVVQQLWISTKGPIYGVWMMVPVGAVEDSAKMLLDDCFLEQGEILPQQN